MQIPDYDFGFTDSQPDPKPEEIKPKKQAKTKASESWENKFFQLKGMILPLLNNLSKSPEKDTIVWPNRKERIDQFIAEIDELEKKIN